MALICDKCDECYNYTDRYKHKCKKEDIEKWK